MDNNKDKEKSDINKEILLTLLDMQRIQIDNLIKEKKDLELKINSIENINSNYKINNSSINNKNKKDQSLFKINYFINLKVTNTENMSIINNANTDNNYSDNFKFSFYNTKISNLERNNKDLQKELNNIKFQYNKIVNKQNITKLNTSKNITNVSLKSNCIYSTNNKEDDKSRSDKFYNLFKKKNSKIELDPIINNKSKELLSQIYDKKYKLNYSKDNTYIKKPFDNEFNIDLLFNKSNVSFKPYISNGFDVRCSSSSSKELNTNNYNNNKNNKKLNIESINSKRLTPNPKFNLNNI